MVSLRVKSFCFYFSLKTGALLICFLNQLMALIGFVVWVSIGFITMSRKRHEQTLDSHSPFLYIHFVFGIVIIATQILMGAILYRGLHKESPRHLRYYVIIGGSIIAVHLCNVGLTVHFAEVVYIYYPTLISIPLQTYFILVVYSASKELAEEQNAFSSAIYENQENNFQNEVVIENTRCC